MAYGLRAIALTLSMLLAPAAVVAVPLIWNLDGVVFSDGGRAFGSFIYDADSGIYSGISIETTGILAFKYTNVVASNEFALDVNAGVIEVGAPFLQLVAVTNLTNQGGSIELGRNPMDTAMYSWETTYVPLCSNYVCYGISHGPALREIVAGYITTEVSVPEPGSLALLTFGLAGLGLSRRRKTH